MDDIAERVAENLHLDMARVGDIALHQQPAVAKTGTRLTDCRFRCRSELSLRLDDRHALAAAAGSGLEQGWEARLYNQFQYSFRLVAGLVTSGNDRNAGSAH